MSKVLVTFAFVLLALFAFGERWKTVSGQAISKAEPAPIIALGEKLFRDARFSTPKGDLPASCSDCHLYDQDPQGMRSYTDFFNRSWVSSRNEDQRRLGLRNAPTLYDVGDMQHLHYDGEFRSLEGLVRGTISGRPMGWMPGEEKEAFDNARQVILNDKGKTGADAYRAQFAKVFTVDATTLSADAVADLIAKSVAAFCRTLVTRKESPYDQFVATNKLPRAPSTGEKGAQFAVRFLSGVSDLEKRNELKLNPAFDKTAVQGLKVFYGSGNCAACHAPPQFTDHSFRNIGVTQREYERFHGEGSFARLVIPDAQSAKRPAAQFREIPSKAKPEIVDLGFWNFVDLKNATQRQSGESDDHLLRRMIGTFKTPTLRNLAYSYPYFHDGSIGSLEGVLEEMMVVSEMARKGGIREGDAELMKIKFVATDVPALVAFLNSLNEDIRRY